MSRPIGFSTGFFSQFKRPYAELIQEMIDLKLTACELHFTDIAVDPSTMTVEALDLAASFEYRSIHLPGTFRYPGQEAHSMMPALEKAISVMKPHALVIHPHIIDDFAWLDSQFGSLLAIENMDYRMPYGTTIEDLEDAYTKLTQARWVCDVNHFFTLPDKMTLALPFHQKFEDRLTHYHVSGFGGTDVMHASLCDTHEDEILTGVLNPEVPIIIESIKWRPDGTLAEELAYIIERLP